MSLNRQPISVSQLSELLGVDPKRFIAVQRVCSREYSGWEVVTEGEDMQTSGTNPPLSDNTSKRKPKRKK